MTGRKVKQYQVNVMAERCKGCGFCIEFCPQRLLRRSNEMNRQGYYIVDIASSDSCTGCNLCSMMCPDFAVSVAVIEVETGGK